MLDLQDKRNLISRQETKIAQKIAAQVIDKPKLSVWMILIPIVFVYYFYSMQRYASGRNDFVVNFVKTRKLILDEACSFIENDKKTDFQVLASDDNVPENGIEPYKKWAKVLYEHYVKLLKTDGDSYASMVKTGYREQGRYLLIQDQISKAEIQFYKSLRNDLNSSKNDEGDVIKKIENSLSHLRRDEARSVFTT